MDYILKRSNRKTLSMSVNKDEKLIVFSPLFIKNSEIDAFVEKNRAWIDTQIEKAERKNKKIYNIPKELLPQKKHETLTYLMPMVEKYSKLTGLSPSKVTVTSAKTRLGSCSGKNSVCFSVYLLNYPKEAAEYVVLHEIAHIKHKNHSAQFYALIEKYMPDFKKRIKLIKNI